MKKGAIIVGSLILAGCTVPQDLLVTPNNSSFSAAERQSAASSVPSSLSGMDEREEIIEFGDAVGAEEKSMASGALLAGRSERLAEHGVFEVGDERANLVLRVFTHQQCRYCKEFADKQMPRLLADLADTGHVRLQIILLRLEKYPASNLHAKAVYCAGKEGKGLAMHRSLFEKTPTDLPALLLHAREMKLTEKDFLACMESPASDDIMHAQQSLAKAGDVTLVPTFFLGEDKFVGLHPYADLRGKVQEALRIRR